MPTVEVLRPFNERHNGGLVHEGDVIEVTETRRDELKRLGLARDPVPAGKAAARPENKMAPAPENKATAVEDLPALPRRRGRPPKQSSAS